MNNFFGKTAFVTGASRGLGEMTARALASAGVQVVIAARSSEKIVQVAQDITASGGKALAVTCDVASYASVEGAVNECVKSFGGIDILVNNAGVIEPIARIADSEPAEWARSISINLIGAYNAVRAVLPHMLSVGAGTILNISSGAAYRVLDGWSAYCSGKAGLAMLTNGLVMETQDKGIRAFGFSPGTIDTDMQAVIRASGMNAISRIPRSELLPVADAVRGLLYLCVDGDDLIGKDVSMRDESFRKRIGL
jgi:3-oxoacyl-[acyl-carrier protein] reductase